MYATDVGLTARRQTSDRRQIKASLNASALWARRHNNNKGCDISTKHVHYVNFNMGRFRRYIRPVGCCCSSRAEDANTSSSRGTEMSKCDRLAVRDIDFRRMRLLRVVATYCGQFC